MAEYLSTTWQLDVMRGSLSSLPKEKREALLPDTSPLDVLVVGTDRSRARGISPTVREGVTISPAILAELNELVAAQRQSFQLLGLTPPALETIHASNNWVVWQTRAPANLFGERPHISASVQASVQTTDAPGVTSA